MRHLVRGLLAVLAITTVGACVDAPIAPSPPTEIRIRVGKLVCLAKEKWGASESYRREVEFFSGENATRGTYFWDPSGDKHPNVDGWGPPSDLVVVFDDPLPIRVEGRISVAGGEDDVVTHMQPILLPVPPDGIRLDPEPWKKCDMSRVE